MSKHLPEQPSLEHLKNEAKALLRLAKTGDPEAIQQVSEPKLANAQLAIARAYGFPSWSKLKRYVEGYASHREAFFAAIKAGARERVTQQLEENPGLVRSYDEHSFNAPPILCAVNRNDKPMIELLLRYGADINARSDWWAGSFGVLDSSDEEMTQYLRSKGATMTAHAAARLGYADELRKMIGKNPQMVHERGGDGMYPLHFSKTAEVVDILMDAGADIEARDIDHEGTPIQHRVLDSEVRQRLFDRGAKTDIFSAIALDRLDLVKEHLQGDPEALQRRVDQPGDPMIHQAPGRAAYCYNLGFVRPFQAAIKLGREEIYAYLFEQSPPNLQLLSAAWKGDRDAVQKTLAEYPNAAKELPADQEKMIVETTWFPRPETLRLMLESGFNVEALDGDQFSATHWAAFHGRVDLIEMLLPHQPQLERKNAYGGTALSTCIYGSVNGWHKEGDYAKAVELLIAAGAQLPEKAWGSAEVVEVLKKHGVA